MNNWKRIWDGKKLDKLNLNRGEFEVFCDLKKADGFDVNVGNEEVYYRSFYHEWISMYQNLNNFSNNGVQSVYEVGCGSGVNLYLFQNRLGKNGQFGGIDYSTNLINIAKRIIHSNDLSCDDAINLDETIKYDLVMADSVFQYFDDIVYAEAVLRKMLVKANEMVYLGELHDSSQKEEWLEYRRKSMRNYDAVYLGLPKMFYSKDWIRHIAEEYNKKVYFTVSENKEYWNSRYLFHCYIY